MFIQCFRRRTSRWSRWVHHGSLVRVFVGQGQCLVNEVANLGIHVKWVGDMFRAQHMPLAFVLYTGIKWLEIEWPRQDEIRWNKTSVETREATSEYLWCLSILLKFEPVLEWRWYLSRSPTQFRFNNDELLAKSKMTLPCGDFHALRTGGARPPIEQDQARIRFIEHNKVICCASFCLFHGIQIYRCSFNACGGGRRDDRGGFTMVHLFGFWRPKEEWSLDTMIICHYLQFSAICFWDWYFALPILPSNVAVWFFSIAECVKEVHALLHNRFPKHLYLPNIWCNTYLCIPYSYHSMYAHICHIHIFIYMWCM